FLLNLLLIQYISIKSLYPTSYLAILVHHIPALFFFFQAEDGIRARNVTGVQTCALPISEHLVVGGTDRGAGRGVGRAPVPGDGGAASPRTARRRISCRGRSPRGGARGRGGALRPAGAAGLRRPLRARPPHREPVPGGGP